MVCPVIWIINLGWSPSLSICTVNTSLTLWLSHNLPLFLTALCPCWQTPSWLLQQRLAATFSSSLLALPHLRVICSFYFCLLSFATAVTMLISWLWHSILQPCHDVYCYVTIYRHTSLFLWCFVLKRNARAPPAVSLWVLLLFSCKNSCNFHLQNTWKYQFTDFISLTDVYNDDHTLCGANTSQIEANRMI